MSKTAVLALFLMGLIGDSVATYAQVPTGIITGNVTDETDAVIPNATVRVISRATGAVRTLTTNEAGLYSAPALASGEYEVRSEVEGFRTTVRSATVQAGGTITVNLVMTLGASKEIVTIVAANAQINYETHAVEGVIQRENIQDLPLNGRSFMQLAALEPGVTVAPGSTAQFNALFTVSVLGAGNRTLFTIDGGSISDNIDTSSGIASMNFSQEAVQEFQLSSVNFDLATGVTAGGAVNVVTRSGTNEFHGSGYFFYRDHNIAAYPALQRSTLNPDPFFARRNPGFWAGGPVIKDKFFFFFNYEHTNQVQAQTVQPDLPSFSSLAGTYGSPYVGSLVTARFDYHISTKHTLFVRYSHDGNSGFGDVFSNGDPSNWVHNTNWADQSIVGLTSTLTPTIVNDARFQFMYWKNANLQSLPSECQFPCVGGSLPSLATILGSNFGLGNAAIGSNFNAPQARITRRYEWVDSLSWQKGTHRFKFGGDANRAISSGLWGFCTPLCTAAFAPETVRADVGPLAPLLFPNLPTHLTTDADFLNLPVLNLTSSIFSGLGVGTTSTPAPYDRNENKPNSVYRLYFQDTWKIRSNFTLNYGLGWNAQHGFYNSDLSKPAYLTPLLGANNLGPTSNNNLEFSPAIGFAWSPFKDNKTVVRGGAGIYWDGTPGYYKLREPASIGPVGDGRSTLAASVLTNTIPGILNLNTGRPIPVGGALPLNALTTMTLGQFLQVYNSEVGAIRQQLTPTPPTSGPYTISGIDVAKQGVEIYPSSFPLARSYQVSIGIQRDLGHDMVLTADFARRQGENVSNGEVDLNHAGLYVNGQPSPVIPTCTSSQSFVPGQECSTGSITFWTDQGRSVYNGLLVKLQKRFSNHFQFVASYALQAEDANGTLVNEINLFQSYGPTIPRHNLTVAGTVSLPWGIQLSVNSSYISRTPVEPVIPNIALPGFDAAPQQNQTLPGLAYNCLNSGCGKTDLANAVSAFNSTYAGTKDSQGHIIPQLVLPSDYQFGDPTFSQDFRLTKNFAIKEKYKLSVFGEMFNAFNIANLSGYSFTLDAKAAPGTTQSFSFGQPTQRAFQSFGSAGPRAVQIGGRISF